MKQIKVMMNGLYTDIERNERSPKCFLTKRMIFSRAWTNRCSVIDIYTSFNRAGNLERSCYESAMEKDAVKKEDAASRDVGVTRCNEDT